MIWMRGKEISLLDFSSNKKKTKKKLGQLDYLPLNYLQRKQSIRSIVVSHYLLVTLNLMSVLQMKTETQDL